MAVAAAAATAATAADATTSPPIAVLITGGSGYLAQHLISRLLPRARQGELRLGYTFNTSDGGTPPLQAKLEPEHASGLVWAGWANLTDDASLDAVVAAFKPTVLIHAAAMSYPSDCERDPARAMAVNCPVSLLDALDAHAPGCLLVFLSTDQVFSGDQPRGSAGYTEADEPAPVNVYGQSKRAFEERLLQLQERRTAAAVILRSSNIIGGPAPFLGQTKFLQWLDEKLKTATAPLELFDDEIRSFVYVGDILNAIEGLVLGPQHRGALAQAPSSGVEGAEESKDGGAAVAIFHMGGPERLSRANLAAKVCALRGYPPTIGGGSAPRVVLVPRASIDLGFPSPLNSAMDSSKLAREVGLDDYHTPMQKAIEISLLGE